MVRSFWLRQLVELSHVFPIVGVLGPRQCGKTTLARQFVADLRPARFYDLEDPADEAALANPMLALASAEGWVVVDEIQRRPDLFPVLRVLADRSERRCRFLLLGSASPEVSRHGAESLAGRIGYVDLPPFTLVEDVESNVLWVRGGFPRSYLADSEPASVRWREGYIRTFLERDLPALGVSLPPVQMRRFWTMIAHLHGGVLNQSSLAASTGMSAKAVKRNLDLLEGAFVLRQLQPWLSNLGKRLVRAPKVYLRDSGLLHRLLGLDHREAVLSHPKLGASWEGFALEQVCATLQARPEETSFWATHNGAEVDLLVEKDGRRLGFEMKWSDAPKFTRSMASALEDLNLESITILTPGTNEYALHERVHVVPLETWAERTLIANAP